MLKKFLLVLLPLASIFPAFTKPGKSKPMNDNELTPAEKKAGWVLLFDGKTLNGWKSYKDRPNDSWEAVNGEIHCKENNVQHRNDLVTKNLYGDFELEFDWKLVKGANSGLIYRANDAHEHTFESGPEYQLIDDVGYPDKLEDWQKSGANYDMNAPSQLTAKPAGEYNHSKIVAKGAHVEHWLNGVKVVDTEFWTDAWKKRKSESKWKDEAEYGMIKSGHICLQDHGGGGVWFKNVKIKKL